MTPTELRGSIRRSLWMAVGVVLIVLWFVRDRDAGTTAALPLELVSYEEALDRSVRRDKLVMLDFYADWCGPCKAMDRVTLRDTAVVELIRNEFLAVKIDAESHDSLGGGLSGSELAERYGVEFFPTYVITDTRGAEIRRFYGYRSPNAYLRELRSALELRED